MIVLYFFLVVGMLNFVVGFDEYESNPYFASDELGVSDACTCVPNNINGVPSPEGCYPYEGCIGTGSGPCDDGIDNDCDCKIDCYDPQCGSIDCDLCSGVCSDPNCAGLPLGPGGEVCSPGGEPVEFCVDGFDNDADGYVDECDADCNGEGNVQSSDIPPYYSTIEVCDEYDNDCDGSVDEGEVCDSSCSSDSDCGTNGWVGYSSCIYDDAYQYYRTYTCNDAGYVSSYCTHEDAQQKKSECYDEYSYCGDWGESYCKDGDVYKSRECRENGCLRGACYGTVYDDEQMVEDCDYGCGEGECLRHCENEIMDGDEEGVDCGGSCNKDCCDNGYEDLDEEGVDCGRSCDYSCVVPVLLVHGYYSNPDTWYNLGAFLDLEGYDYYPVDIRKGYLGVMIANGDIKEASEKIRDNIYDLKKEYRAKEVDIIAHSMGGLVSRWYVNRVGENNVRNLVMLGTPNHGSELFYGRYVIKLVSYLSQMELLDYVIEKTSDFLIGEAGVQMTPYNSFLNELNNGDPWVFGERRDIISPSVSHYTYLGIKDNWATTWILSGEDDGLVRQDSVKLKGVGDVPYDVDHGELKEWLPLFAHVRDNVLSQGVSLGLSDVPVGNLSKFQELPLIIGNISEPGQRNHTVRVDSVERVVFDLVWLKGVLEFSLRSPSGVLKLMNNYNSSNDIVFEIENPEEGLWELYVYGSELNGTTEYNIFTFLETNLSLVNIIEKYQYDRDEIVYLKVNLSEDANVTARVVKPDGTEEVVYLYDEGGGVYGIAYSGTELYGMYDVTVKAEGSGFEREIGFAFWVEGFPDLAVNYINLSDISDMEVQDIVVNAGIENLADFDAENATIELILEDLWGGEVLDSEVVDVDGYDEIVVYFNWTNVPVGTYNISVQVSPFNGFIELNYSNNEMSRVIDLCVPNWVEVFDGCQMDDTYTGWFNDTNDCYARTGLEEDNEPPLNNTYSCDFCVPNWMEVFNECQMDDTYTTWYDDVNDCYAVTGLESDNEPPLDNTEEVVEMRVLCPSEVYREEGVVQIGVGEYHTCALKSDGNVECWGSDSYGQTENYTGGDAVQISVGERHTCILKSNRNVECWGDNLFGKTDNYNGRDAVQVSAGQDHTCILNSYGFVYCRGSSLYGQNFYDNSGYVIQVSAGLYYTCMLKSYGFVECRGNNYYGEADDYVEGDAVKVSVGGSHSCILKSDGNVVCRGDNRYGQAENYTEGDAVQISAGERHTCILKSDGDVECNGGGFDYSEMNAVQVSAKGGRTCVLAERIVNRPLVYECEYMHQTQIPLVSDWNLISIPLKLSNDSIEITLASIDGMYDTVFEYDSLGNEWESYYTDEPEFLNSIERIIVSKGYWVNMVENSSLNVSGRLLSSVNYSLYDGWNLIGYPSLIVQNITDTLLDVNDSFTSVFAFDDNVWKSYSPEKPSFMNSLDIMRPGYGYWVKVDDDVDWMFNGSYYER